MADIKLKYGNSSALTISPASLATSATLLVGVESNAVDNTTDRYLDYLLTGKITTGTSPTDFTEIRIFVVGLQNDSTWPDPFDGTASSETIAHNRIRDQICRVAAPLLVDGTSDRAYPFGPISVAGLFGGTLPKKFVVFITHNTGVALNATAGNHAVYITPVYQSIE